jgi:hypothetical protein
MKLKFSEDENSLLGDVRGELVRFENKAGKVISIIYYPNQPVMIGVNAFDGKYYEWYAKDVELFTADSLLGE